MATPTTADFRATIVRLPSGALEVVIPVKRRPLVIGLLTVFLGLQTFWFFFFVMLLVSYEREAALSHGHHTFTRAFAGYMPFWMAIGVQMLVWLVLTCGGLYQWAWHVFGREFIRVGGSRLTVRREVAWFENTRVFDLDAVRGLRFERPDTTPWLDPWLWRNPIDDYERGCLVFGYQYKGYLEKEQLGDDLDEAEGAHLIQAIGERIKPPPEDVEIPLPVD